ncbi:MAG: PhnD/SsuA/transferrin family substrate-binding protein [Planctomycetota bacterium]
MKTISKQRLGVFLVAAVLIFLSYLIGTIVRKTTRQMNAAGDADNTPLRIVVMDPLSGQLACDCVEGYAQRKYDKLSTFLEKQLRRPVQIAYGENLKDVLKLDTNKIDLIIGKHSVVLSDAAEAKMTIHPIARLTDKSGGTDLTGLFVVRHNDLANSIEDLEGYRILFGPEYDAEKSNAAMAALRAQGLSPPQPFRTSPSCSTAAVAVVEREADAAVISSYDLALLEGCDTIDRGALRVVGETCGVPFVTVFATDSVTQQAEELIMHALLCVRDNKTLLAEMESKAGFIGLRTRLGETTISNTASPVVEWTDWRGPNRDAVSPYVPKELPTKATFLWKRPMTGLGLSGITATGDYVIVADKDKENEFDIFRCLDADTGKQVWTIEYPAAGEMDFSNSPRANPVIHQGLTYLLGAFGDLHCVKLDTGQVVWKKNIVKDMGAELPAWGMCSTPLIVDDKLIVNPGAGDASIVALDRRTGRVIWKTPGEPAAYSSLILGTFGNVRQIVGYDAISLGGWDPNSGKRLWELLPKEEGDFNVPTPINVDGKLLVTTENNGTRLYGFNKDGKIQPKPLAHNLDLAPDTSTPVVTDGLVFGCFGGLFCLDLENELRTLYSVDDDAFYDYASLIAGNDHVLITTVEGELVLIRSDGNRYTIQSRLRLFEDTEVWSHPALIGNRLYIRNRTELCCVSLDK